MSYFASNATVSSYSEDNGNAANPVPAAGIATPVSPPATFPTGLHVHCEEWFDCVGTYFYENGVFEGFKEDKKDTGCAPDETAVDLTAAGTMPTTLSANGFDEYNLEVTTDATNGLTAAQFAAFAAALDKPAKGEGQMYTVWNVGTGTIQATHPRVATLTLTANQGDAICLVCKGGAWGVALV